MPPPREGAIFFAKNLKFIIQIITVYYLKS